MDYYKGVNADARWYLSTCGITKIAFRVFITSHEYDEYMLVPVGVSVAVAPLLCATAESVPPGHQYYNISTSF